MVQSSLRLWAAYTLTDIILSHLVYWHKSKFIVIIKSLHHRCLSNLFIAQPFYSCIKVFIIKVYCFHFSHSFVVCKLAKSTPIPSLPVLIANNPNKVVLRTILGTFLRCIIVGWWPSVRPLAAPTLSNDRVIIRVWSHQHQGTLPQRGGRGGTNITSKQKIDYCHSDKPQWHLTGWNNGTMTINIVDNEDWCGWMITTSYKKFANKMEWFDLGCMQLTF